MIAKVRGFVPDDQVQREHCDVCADLGAIECCLHLLDDNRAAQKFGNLRYVLASGHEMMSEMKAVLKVVREYGYDEVFAAGYGFGSDKQKNILFRGYDFHICMEFLLDICRPIMIDLLIEGWIDSSKESAAQSSVDELLAHISSQSELSEHYKCHADLATTVLSSMALIRKGIRNNVKAMHEAGRKTILPIMGLLNHISYFKAIIRDLYEYGYRAHGRIQKHRRKNFTFGSGSVNKEPPDFWMENTIKDMKPMITSDDSTGFETAALLANSKNDITSMLYKQAGKKAPELERRRAPTKLTKTLSNIRAKAKPHNPFTFVSDSSSSSDTELMNLLRTKKLPPSSSWTSLVSTGRDSITQYVQSGRKTLPTRVVLSFQTDADYESDAGGEEGVVGGGGGGDGDSDHAGGSDLED